MSGRLLDRTSDASFEGSRDFAAFVTLVQVVAPVSVGLPAATASYKYRTFSLRHGIHPGGLLRVRVPNQN